MEVSELQWKWSSSAEERKRRSSAAGAQSSPHVPELCSSDGTHFTAAPATTGRRSRCSSRSDCHYLVLHVLIVLAGKLFPFEQLEDHSFLLLRFFLILSNFC